MATRSIITVSSTVNKKTESIYCHWDGYPKGVGVMLARSYPEIAHAYELIKNGDCSSLGFTIEECRFFKDTKGGEYPATENESVEHCLNEYLPGVDEDRFSGIEFVYVHFGGLWFVGSQFEDLSIDKDNHKLLPVKFGRHKLYSLAEVLFGKGSKSIKRIEELMQ